MFAWVGLLLDSMAIVLSGLAAWWLVLPSTEQPLIYAVLVLITLMAWGLLMPLMGLNRSSRAVSNSDWMLKLATALGLISLTVVMSLWAFKLAEDFSRLWLVLWFVITGLALIGWRLVAFAVLKRLRASGYNHKHIVIVGAGRLGQAIASKIQASPWSGFEVAAFFDDDSTKIGISINGILVVSADELSGWLETHSVDEIWFALPLRAEPRLQALLHALRHTTANIRYVPNLSSLRLLNHSPREVLGFSMLDLSVSPMSEPMSRLLKSIEDKLISGLILLLISPIMLLLAIGVKLSSPGPIFYRQQRVGLKGELFAMLKFRSMPVDVEKDGVQWGSAGSKTNTWFGAFIRKTSLDELPQFINVLKGDMSIV
ncbi:MAG TPA: exopolysaccharide biosynthesis polyprenyl glycosylphosphotransferase, partial [Thiotrichales bacterium]|nr:exopolysaccharide biosynthesis polyprenyl glycosylphosphotransferase [Thiotrichales bacterium]